MNELEISSAIIVRIMTSPNQVAPRCTGKALFVECHDILLDMRCSRTMVLQDIVALEKVVVGKVARMTCAHRDTKVRPLTRGQIGPTGCLHLCRSSSGRRTSFY